VAAEDEARELLAVARDADHLDELVTRREAGEPLAWVIGRATFCGLSLVIEPGLYVPRWQTEAVASTAAELSGDGVAVDLCTGIGAVAAALQSRRGAGVLASDIDPHAVACAQRNGVDAVVGDLFDPLPDEARGRVDVVVAVAPYVPSDVARTMRTLEPPRAIDGGYDGLRLMRRIVSEAPAWLRRFGHLVLEIGGPQVDAVGSELRARGFDVVTAVRDGDGDLCGITARFHGTG